MGATFPLTLDQTLVSMEDVMAVYCATLTPAPYAPVRLISLTTDNMIFRAFLPLLSLSGPFKEMEIETFMMVRSRLVVMCTLTNHICSLPGGWV